MVTALTTLRLQSTCSTVVVHGLSCTTAWGGGALSESGIEYMPPVLEGRLFTTEPPGMLPGQVLIECFLDSDFKGPKQLQW